MKKSSLVYVSLVAALSIGTLVVAPTPTHAAVLAHQVKVQGELGRVFINPYDIVPLTAVIDRAGKDIKDVSVRVLGKSNDGVDINYKVSQHAILNHDGVPIWGLYPDYLNKVEVSYTFEGQTKKEMYKIYAQPIVSVSRDFRFDHMQKTEVKKVDKNFKDRLYFINNTITGINKPFDWRRGGAASWNDYTENFIVDTKGEVRWYLDYTKFYDRSERIVEKTGMMMGFHQLDNGDLSFGMSQRYMRYDLMGKEVYNRALPKGYIDLSHEVLPLKGDHLLLRVGKYDYHHKNGKVSHTVRDHIIEVDGTGKVVEEWDLNEIFGANVYRSNLIKALDPRAVCLNIDMNAKEIKIEQDAPFGDKLGAGTGYNWAHVNSISYDASDDSIILSLRHQGIVKIGRDKKVKWILASPEGWSDDFKAKVLNPVDANGKKIKCENSKCEGEFDWSWTQHTAWLTPRYENKGTTKYISVFDNGDGRGMEQPVFKEDKYSRAVEYKIDEKNLTVQQTWQFGKERGFDFYSAVTSNVEYQKDKGTYYISSSNVNLLKPDKTIKMVLVEIDPKTNDIKFEMDVHSASRDDVAYRSLVINPNVFEY